jgi:hypothetical protein
MSRRTAVAIIAAALLLSLILLVVGSRDDPRGPVTESAVTDDVTTDLPDDVDVVLAELYFPDQDGSLSPEGREVVAWSSPEQGARTLLAALFSGPEDELLSAPLPTEAKLGTVHLTEAGILYVDIVSTELSRPPSTGSQEELLSIWSLVDTAMLGVPEIRGVVLTWNSRQLTSFGGHVDTSLPLVADPDLIRTRR